jgi:RNA polymerase sigma factor (sigma-70 family)
MEERGALPKQLSTREKAGRPKDSGHPSKRRSWAILERRYLPRPFDDENLLSAVKRALERSSDQWLQHSQRKEMRDRLATLTPREFEVLKCVIAGMLNKQIASQLGTTEGTIKVHRGRVMEKMGATSVAELVILAQKAGIAPASADATKV